MTEKSRLPLDAFADAVCATAVVVGQVVSGAIFLATVLYGGWLAVNGFDPFSFISEIRLVPFLGTIVAGRNLRKTLHGRPPRPFAHAWFVGFVVASTLASLEWFKDPMHDIAAWFGSHGRFGCGVYGEDGSPAFLLRDETMPFILFAPVLLVTSAHWLVRTRARVD